MSRGSRRRPSDADEHALCERQRVHLCARERSAAADLDAAREQYAGEEKDVERLERLSLTRVLAVLHGSRQDVLAREKAEAEAARYQVAQAQQRLDAVRAELSSMGERQARLAGAPQAYADALAAKEEYLTDSADPRGARLLALAEERGQLTAELGELRRASGHAGAAAQALTEVQDRLAAPPAGRPSIPIPAMAPPPTRSSTTGSTRPRRRRARPISGWRRSVPTWPSSAATSQRRPSSRSSQASGSPTSSSTTSSRT